MKLRRSARLTGLTAFALGAAACSSSGEIAATSSTSSSQGGSTSTMMGSGGSGHGGDTAGSQSSGTGVGGSGGSGGSKPGLDGFYPGANLSGAEFGSGVIPGVINTNYTYPKDSEVDYFVSKGLRIFRLPFLWARLQPALDADLDAAELGRITKFVTYASSKGAKVLLDPHNYGRYNGKVIGYGDAGAPTAEQFGAFWAKLATVFANDPQVIFGLMNEPHGMKTELWLDDANAAIAAIRKVGANNTIFVPGNGYTGAGSWVDSTWYGTPNDKVMLGVKDPIDNFVFEMHLYLDTDSSGTHADCKSATVGSERVTKVTEWLTTNKVRGFIGEFAVGENPICEAALEDLLTYIDKHRDVWVGWTWWGAGPWWPKTYMFSIEPNDGTNMDRPQLQTLMKHL
jgi:endoglucanase